MPLKAPEEGLRLRTDQNPVEMAMNQQRQRNRHFNARSNSENRYDGYERKYGIQVQENIRSNIAMNSPQNIRNNASKENFELQRSNQGSKLGRNQNGSGLRNHSQDYRSIQPTANEANKPLPNIGSSRQELLPNFNSNLERAQQIAAGGKPGLGYPKPPMSSRQHYRPEAMGLRPPSGRLPLMPN